MPKDFQGRDTTGAVNLWILQKILLLKEQEMVIISDLIAKAVENKDNESELKKIEGEVRELCLSFPIYKELLN